MLIYTIYSLFIFSTSFKIFISVYFPQIDFMQVIGGFFLQSAIPLTYIAVSPVFKWITSF